GTSPRSRLNVGQLCCPQHAESSSSGEQMSLTGLLGTVAEDPQLRQALEYAGLPGAGDADLVAPPALRPVLVAALAALSGRVPAGTDAGAEQARFVLAITATAREAEDLT